MSIENAIDMYADARITSQDMLLDCHRLSNKCQGDTEMMAALNVMTSVIKVFSRMAADKLLAERGLNNDKGQGIPSE